MACVSRDIPANGGPGETDSTDDVSADGDGVTAFSLDEEFDYENIPLERKF